RLRGAGDTRSSLQLLSHRREPCPQPAFGRLLERADRLFTSRLHRGVDSAARLGNFFVRRAGRAHRNLAHSVTCVYRVRVCVDETGGDEAVRAIVIVGHRLQQLAWFVAELAAPGDPLPVADHRGALDHARGGAGDQAPDVTQ